MLKYAGSVVRAGNGGAMPAVMNAVIHALEERGVTHLQAPASPHRVWQALRDAAQGGRV